MARIDARWFGIVAVTVVVAAAVAFGVDRGLTTPAAAATSAVSGDTVTVSGVGTADAAPDTLTVDFTVHAAYADVQTTLNTVSLRARKVLAALHAAGVKEPNLRTSDLQLNRNYNRYGTPIGYAASETVEARITPLADAGRAIAAAAHATDHVDIGNLNFDIAHDSALLRQARANAFADARSRAEQYAGLAADHLGKVESIRETVSSPPSTYPNAIYGDAAAGLAKRMSPAVIRGGRQTLTVRDTIVWSLT